MTGRRAGWLAVALCVLLLAAQGGWIAMLVAPAVYGAGFVRGSRPARR